MKIIGKKWALCALLYFLIAPAAVHADKDLDSFVSRLNIEASADLGGFKARLSAQFGVTAAQADLLIRDVDRPADAYMCLRVSQITQHPTDVVLKEYRNSKGKGWGVIAKHLGIKPGSKEFHELKKGDLEPSPEKGQPKGKKKGH